MIQANFETAVSCGMIGEQEVRAMLEAEGCIIYQPQTSGSHQLDMIAIKDKKTTIAADVKTKARRTYYSDTGVNESHFKLYREFMEKHNLEFYIYFVDRSLGKIYGNTINELEKRRWHEGILYPRVERVKHGRDAGTLIRYWPMIAMLDFATLSEATAKAIRQFEQRNYKEPEEQLQVFFDFNLSGASYV